MKSQIVVKRSLPQAIGGKVVEDLWILDPGVFCPSCGVKGGIYDRLDCDCNDPMMCVHCGSLVEAAIWESRDESSLEQLREANK